MSASYLKKKHPRFEPNRAKDWILRSRRCLATVIFQAEGKSRKNSRYKPCPIGCLDILFVQ